MFIDSRGLSERRRMWLDRTTIAMVVLGIVAWVCSSFLDNEPLASWSVAGVFLCVGVSSILLNGFRFLLGVLIMTAPLGIAMVGDESEVWNRVWFWVVTGVCEIAATILLLYAGRKRVRQIEAAERRGENG
jgi:hypothetical protein